ncbi:Glycosyltransferase involved in cell wall bisynthesis [Roseomonas rosea]|uniref:Glycosyltransferase involved in cell wall bisynthesis n=1 Tax=Muricoccus roseus TaxID=198092 RepID=A0A1M6C634_9PROT|nr:glycosyltransferase [Roseomonas rosea]SHI56198.1 Glycosyltransferase involved in cell wall bisynthesis [Roseomonas rosea]
MSALHRIWSLLPRSARREALFSFTAALAPRIARPDPAPALPVTVAGYFKAATGLGAATRRLAAGLREQGLAVGEADLTGPLRQGPAGPRPVVPPGPGTLLVHVNGPMLPWALLSLGRGAVAGKRVIGVWNWELPVLPADWNRGFAACHEIWAGTEFVADACRRPGGPPVRVVPYPMPRPAPSALGRTDFGLPDGAFVTLAVFDATSSLARKNPLGAIEAHARAFSDDPGHILLLKTHGTAQAGLSWAAVAEAAAARPNVRVMDASLSRGDLWALMAASDVLLSLHRSEGYGFAIAEMMELGRPVVATGWSGNMDFMQGPGCLPVGYRLVPARDPQDTYEMPAACWAEPDPEEAAAALRRVAAEPALQRPPPVRFPPPDYRAALGLA